MKCTKLCGAFLFMLLSISLISSSYLRFIQVLDLISTEARVMLSNQVKLGNGLGIYRLIEEVHPIPAHRGLLSVASAYNRIMLSESDFLKEFLTTKITVLNPNQRVVGTCVTVLSQFDQIFNEPSEEPGGDIVTHSLYKEY